MELLILPLLAITLTVCACCIMVASAHCSRLKRETPTEARRRRMGRYI